PRARNARPGEAAGAGAAPGGGRRPQRNEGGCKSPRRSTVNGQQEGVFLARLVADRVRQEPLHFDPVVGAPADGLGPAERVARQAAVDTAHLDELRVVQLDEMRLGGSIRNLVRKPDRWA